MYKVRYLPLAEADVLEAVSYIADTLDAPKAAADLLEALDEAVEQIAVFPYAYPLYRTTRPMKDELRMAVVKNYVLYYSVNEDSVELRRFLHGRRDRDRWL